MTPGKFVLVGLLCVVLCIIMATAVAPVYAAAGADKDLGEKKGIKGAFKTKDGKDAKKGGGPNKVQMAVGVGSLFVMIAVVKYA